MVTFCLTGEGAVLSEGRPLLGSIAPRFVLAEIRERNLPASQFESDPRDSHSWGRNEHCGAPVLQRGPGRCRRSKSTCGKFPAGDLFGVSADTVPSRGQDPG